MEGAGVRLKRAFGNEDAPMLDPFLLLDDFHSDNPDDYIAGFPWHPHRGIETVSYMLSGRVNHEDSIGNSGTIGPGDVQWMTAGSGIIHSEMPQRVEGVLRGLQLWVNLPANHKMMLPRYQEIQSNQIPEKTLSSGVTVKVICGDVQGTQGPVRDIVVDPEYLDVTVPAGAVFEHEIKEGYTAFAYVLEGSGYFDAEEKQAAPSHHLVVFSDGKGIKVKPDNPSGYVRFLLVSGKPIGEPVAWYGPIVMNTQEELQTAFREYQEGMFIKHK
jgi:redox-sensitive bicupin YhaK (pirin superfamily)